MKRRRHLIGGALLVVVALVLAVDDWAVLDTRVLGPLAVCLAAVGLANVAAGIGWPAGLRDRRGGLEAVTALAFAFLAGAIVIERTLAPEGPLSYLLAALWGSVALFAAWLGIDRLRSGD